MISIPDQVSLNVKKYWSFSHRCLIERFAYLYDVRKIFWILLFCGKKKKRKPKDFAICGAESKRLFAPVLFIAQPLVAIKQMIANGQTKIKLEPLTLKDSSQVFKLFNNKKVLQSYLEKPIVSEDRTTDFIKRITTKTNKSIEIGGTLFPKFWGNDIMFKAFQLLIEKARNEFKITQVIGKTLPTNKKALRLAEKLGFEVLSTHQEETVLVKELT